jgi:hypothetical protein
VISRGHGRILNMASAIALKAEPLLSSYYVGGHPDDIGVMVPRAQEIRDRDLYVLRQEGETYST